MEGKMPKKRIRAKKKYHEFKKEQEEKVKQKGQEVSPNVYFMKQTIGNACGTVAIIHSIANNTDVLEFDENGFLKSFVDSTKSLSPDEKGKKLEDDEKIGDIHEACAQEGQTEAPSAEEHVELHFVAIVHKDGSLYELDGRKSCPINHGTTTKETFLQDAAEVCKEYMKRDPTALNFTVVALSSTQ